jgi:hypothetical protein
MSEPFLTVQWNLPAKLGHRTSIQHRQYLTTLRAKDPDAIPPWLFWHGTAHEGEFKNSLPTIARIRHAGHGSRMKIHAFGEEACEKLAICASKITRMIAEEEREEITEERRAGVMLARSGNPLQKFIVNRCIWRRNHTASARSPRAQAEKQIIERLRQKEITHPEVTTFMTQYLRKEIEKACQWLDQELETEWILGDLTILKERPVKRHGYSASCCDLSFTTEVQFIGPWSVGRWLHLGHGTIRPQNPKKGQ